MRLRPAAVAAAVLALSAVTALSPALADPAPTAPQPGDSATTLAARAKLAQLIAQVRTDVEQYDQSEAALKLADAALVAARARYTRDQAFAEATRSALVATAVQNYITGVDVSPDLSIVATSTDPSQLLDGLGLIQQVAGNQAAATAAADQATAAADTSRTLMANADAHAQAVAAQAAAALAAAQTAQQAASTLVATAHLSDLRQQAAEEQANARTAADAAEALKTQALSTGAAGEAEFAGAHNVAAVIAVADNALLRQAAGYTAPPRPLPGAPAFVRTSGEPVDEQAVMGPAPKLGRVAPYVGGYGHGPVRALERFADDPAHDNWPGAGVGLGVPGTAKPRPANGSTVAPVIPVPTGAVPRASMALDQALGQLGLPYVWDAAGPSTYDCSGLTLWAWGHAGVGMPHSAAGQVLLGVPVQPNQLLPGDLIMFGTAVHHVGLYLGAGFMVDAPDTGEYVKIQRVSDDGDFSIAVRP
jgi:cell wall-associated NlpC family hydrolase